MGTIHRPSDFVDRGNDTTTFIQCINGQQPQIKKLWCLGLDGIFREVHPIARVDILAGTVGEFVTNHLSENGRPINIIRKLSVNNSVQFWGLSDQSWGSRLPFISNLLDQVEATGWGGYNNSNQNWGGHLNNANSITNIAWSASVNSLPDYLLQIPVNTCASRRRVHKYFLRCRHQERLWFQYNHRNPLFNTRVRQWGKDRDVTVNQ